jgi:hypothetical protein
LSLGSQKYGFGIREPEKKPFPDPRSRELKMHQIPDPEHWFFVYLYNVGSLSSRHPSLIVSSSHWDEKHWSPIPAHWVILKI